MPADKDKIEDFVTLWKNKSQRDNQPSIIGETMIQLEKLKKENDDLRKKIADNIELISKSEDVIKNLSTDRERLRIEQEESVMDLTMRVDNLERENVELGNKVKNMVKVLMEKDEEIKKLNDQINSGDLIGNERFKSDLSKKNETLKLLNKQILELKDENEKLRAQLVEKIKSVPTFVLPGEQAENKVLKPLPPEPSSEPLELLCQDLQTDLNKYKKIIEQLNQEKNQLKDALGREGITFNVEELNTLKHENIALRKDLQQLQDSLSDKLTIQSRPDDQTIKELQEKLLEKEHIITELKLSQVNQISAPKGPMTDLVDELQQHINKLKHTIQEKDQQISELKNTQNP
jgi:chromosome segregation ATPase